MTRSQIVDWALSLYEDLDFYQARQWASETPSGKAVGHLPVYAPREVIHASKMLPVGIYGGGDQVEIIRGDAFYQSYICHIPRSVVELCQAGNFDFLSGVLFPSTCDVIRNLSGMWQLLKPEQYVRYVDLPQIGDPQLGSKFWGQEIRTLVRDLGEISGSPANEDQLRESVALFNESRQLIRALYEKRSKEPWRIPTEELYLLMRAGEIAPVEIFNEKLRTYLAAADEGDYPVKDRSRVVVAGAFCEQPPLGLIKTIERAGCYIVDDDFLVGNRLLLSDVSLDGSVVDNLARSFFSDSEKTSVLYESDPEGKKKLMKARVDAVNADGIIFAAPSFCDPALLDRPMLRKGAEENNIPCIAFKYAENTGQFQQFREQAGTFSDSIKLWGGQ